MSEAGDRLERLLCLVPYLARHPGIPVDALARNLGTTRATILRDLELLPLVGRPPFSPADYLDLTVENGKVTLTLDQRFSRPPRLTAPEAAALVAAANLLDPRPGDPLRVALNKMEAILPAQARVQLKGLTDRVTGGGYDGLQGLVGQLATATAKAQEVVLEYLAPTSERPARRTVQPWRVFHHGGHWYMLGFDVGKDAQRSFRADRISRLTLTDARFERPRNVPQVGEEFKGYARSDRPSDRPTLRFSKRLATWALDRFGDEATLLRDGRVRVELQGATQDWLVAQVLQNAGDVDVLGPSSLREAVQRAVEQALQGYR